MDKAPFPPVRKKRVNRTLLFSIVCFTFLLGFLFLTSDPGSITGNSIESGEFVQESVNINADLSCPDSELALDGVFSRIEIKGSSEDFLNSGNQKIELTKSSFIVLENFDGKISFDSDKVTFIKGDAGKITVNGVPVLPSKNHIDTKFEGELGFSSLEIESGVYIGSLSYVASGDIDVNGRKTVVNLDQDTLTLGGYYGSLEIRDDFELNGVVVRLEIDGDTSLSIS